MTTLPTRYVAGPPYVVGEGRPQLLSFSEQPEQQQQTGPTPPATPAPGPPASEAPAAPPQNGPGPAGGPQAVLADLAAERDRRQAAERRIAELEQAETRRAAEAQQQAQAQESAETQRVRAELAAREQQAQAQAAVATANWVRAEARRVAIAAGVHDDRSETFLRLVDLSAVPLDASGSPDQSAIRTAVEAGLTAAPEFRPAAGGPRRAPQLPGSTPPGATPAQPADLQTRTSQLLLQMQNAAGFTPSA